MRKRREQQYQGGRKHLEREREREREGEGEGEGEGEAHQVHPNNSHFMDEVSVSCIQPIINLVLYGSNTTSLRPWFPQVR